MKNLKIMFLISLLSFSSTTFAGYSQPAEVTVDNELMMAMGDMVSARNSRNKFALIGCGTRHNLDEMGNMFSFGFCQAAVEEEASVVCFTQNPELLAKMSEINDNSFVTFSWDENGDCTRVGFSTQSFYLAKSKKNKKDKDD